MATCARKEIIMSDFPRLFPRLAGRVDQISQRAKEVGRRWLHGVRPASRVFTSGKTS